MRAPRLPASRARAVELHCLLVERFGPDPLAAMGLVFHRRGMMPKKHSKADVADKLAELFE